MKATNSYSLNLKSMSYYQKIIIVLCFNNFCSNDTWVREVFVSNWLSVCFDHNETHFDISGRHLRDGPEITFDEFIEFNIKHYDKYEIERVRFCETTIMEISNTNISVLLRVLLLKI